MPRSPRNLPTTAAAARRSSAATSRSPGVRLSGRRARGYRSPGWDLSINTVDLLLTHGFEYDSSLMGGDYWPYRVRRGDQSELGKPFRFGEETQLLEMPISWSLDDYPHFEFVRSSTAVLPGLQSPRAVTQSWLDEFHYMQRSVEWGVLTYTMHPFVIGRGSRMLALEDLIAKLSAAGAAFMTMEEAAAETRARIF
jgi:peptidoglycan-N-acetylglucosamine deacetylase